MSNSIDIRFKKFPKPEVSRLKVSFILPALNELQHIKGVLSSIHQYASSFDAYEVILIDNGSTDDTVVVARENHAIVYSKPGLRVGALRNFGASIAQFDYLVFLDADVYLTQSWQQRILPVLDSLTEKENIITGSICGISINPSVVEYCWWEQAKERKSISYINSGHMIMRRQTFYKLGGFDEHLKTGEDSEFCRRPRDIKVRIVHDKKLHVIHEGYPKTWYQFFKRERWHGLGDYASLRIFLHSKPALISIMQFLLLIVLIAIAIILRDFRWLFLYATIILPLCILVAYKRCNKINTCLLVNTGLYFIYFWARAISFWDNLLNNLVIHNSKVGNKFDRI